MKTHEFIVWSILLLAMIWLWWRQKSYIRTLKSVASEINGMISEAKTVRDEIQKLFDEFEQTIENDLKIEVLKAKLQAIVQEEQAMEEKNEEKTTDNTDYTDK